MRTFVKGREVEAADIPFQIAKMNVLEMFNHVAASEIDIGLGTTSTLIQAIKEMKLGPLQIFEFRKEYCTVLATIINKI